MVVQDALIHFLFTDSNMAKGFGELSNVRGIIKYSISPFEQRAFAGAISKGLPNLFRRFRSKFFIVAPRKYILSQKAISC